MRRIVLVILLLLLVIRQQTVIRRAEQRVRCLRADIGPGRGQVPRAAERRFPAIDVYSQYADQGNPTFRAMTRFSQLQFDDLVHELSLLIAANRCVRPNVPGPSGEERACKLTVQNRLLMTVKFLVAGGSCADLGSQFGLSPAAVSEELRHVIFAIVAGLNYEIRWPSAEQQQTLRGLLGPRFANAIGTLDGTYTQSFRRAGDYSGHRHMFMRHHQVAADCFGYVIHVVAGGVGSRHDSYHYRRSDVGRRLEADNSDLLVDSGYIGLGAHLIPPATASSHPDADERERFNLEHTSRRSRIEQFIGRIKALFTVAARKWTRADRRFLAVCFVASCILYNRVKRLNE